MADVAPIGIVRKDTGAGHTEFPTELAIASGIETPTRENLAKLNRKRKKKCSNTNWESPHDPDAKVAKMKDCRTHLAHKSEHAVDMDTEAIVAVTVQSADRGDTTSLGETIMATVANLLDVPNDPATEPRVHAVAIEEGVMDKEYHSNATMTELSAMGIRGYVSEPEHGERKWKGKAAAHDAAYANRRRIRGKHDRGLMRQRVEKVERTFAHRHETGGMRRTYLRGHPNILKRLLIHVGGFNLGLAMRSLFGIGRPRRLQDGLGRLAAAVLRLLASRIPRWTVSGRVTGVFGGIFRQRQVCLFPGAALCGGDAKTSA